jgi:NADPH2:quinone reductase
MRAVVVDHWMDPKDLTVREVPDLPCGAAMVRVAVKAAGCNFFDILMVRGQYQQKPPFPFTPGAEIAGVVTEVGPEVEGFRVGDRVLASCGLGGFADQAVVAARACYRMPDPMPFEHGAAFPIVYPTSYAALVYRTTVKPGETLLVHAAAGGVGIAAVQIGKTLGATVIGTAGGPEKLAIAKRVGADVVVDYRDPDWVEQVKAATGGRGADVVYDSVGGDVTDQSLKCIAWNGRLLVIGFASGRIPEVKLNRVLLKNISLIGLHWGAHAFHEPQTVVACFDALLELQRTGAIDPVIYRTYPLDELPAALDALGSRQSYGKVIVAP